MAGGAANLSLLGLITHDVSNIVLACCDADTRAQMRMVSKTMRDEVDDRIEKASCDIWSWEDRSIDRLLNCLPQLPWLARLKVGPCGTLTAEAATLLTGWALARPAPTLATKLRELELGGPKVATASLEVLLSVPWPRLSSLYTSVSESGERGAGLLARAAQQGHLLHLQRLRLGGCDAPALKQMAGADWGELIALSLHGFQIDASAVRALASSLGPALRELDLYYARIGTILNTLVSQQSKISGLQRLTLDGLGNGRSSDGVMALAGAGWALKFLELVIPGELTGQAAAALAAIPSLKSITFHIQGDELTGQAAVALAALPSLTSVYFSFVGEVSTDISISGFQTLSLSARWIHVRELKLDIYSPPLSALRAAAFPSLSKLVIFDQACSDEFYDEDEEDEEEHDAFVSRHEISWAPAMVSAAWHAAPVLRELCFVGEFFITNLEEFAAKEWPSLSVDLSRAGRVEGDLASVRARFPWLKHVRVIVK